MHFIPEWSTTRIVTSEVEPTDADRHNNKVYRGPAVNVLKQVLGLSYLPEDKTAEGECSEESQDIARDEIEPVTLQKFPLKTSDVQAERKTVRQIHWQKSFERDRL